MDLLVISGFLGSGKTSMILATIERIREQKNKKTVIVVNDFGKMGIDGKVMERFGLQVKEIPSGCICCTLGPDLLKTLRSVAETLDPDLVVVEPSGVADPGAIRELLRFYDGPPMDSVRTVVLVDALRHGSISRALGNLVRKQLRAADVILINKVDEASQEVVHGIEEEIRALGIRPRVIPVSATAGTNLDQVVEAMVE